MTRTGGVVDIKQDAVNPLSNGDQVTDDGRLVERTNVVGRKRRYREERRRERIGSCRGTRQGGRTKKLKGTRRDALEQREPKEKRLNDGKETKAALVTTIRSKGERRSNALRVGGGEGGTGTNERREGVACFVERGDGEKRIDRKSVV